MKIAIGCDHAAYNEKNNLIRFIESELGFKVIDVGTNSEDSVDYAEYGHMVGKLVSNKEVDKGIVICGSGIGISIAANKIKGIRAALCTSIEHAEMSRKHNNANILAVGARFTSFEDIKLITKMWFSTDFEGGRHLRRINKIEEC
jgi:ribose 5-phosphate isomerase B